MRVRVWGEIAEGEICFDRRCPAYTSVIWDPDLSQLSLALGRQPEGLAVTLQLGPAEAAELYRRLRESYPPAQRRRRSPLRPAAD